MAAKIMRLSIGIKAAIFMAIVFLLPTIFALFVTSRQDRQHDLDEIAERSRQLARSAAAIARYDAATTSESPMDAFFEEIARQPGVVYVFAVGPNGRILADGDPTKIDSYESDTDRLATRAWSQGAELMETEGEVLHVALPIQANGSSSGVVRLGMSLRAMQARTLATLMRDIIFAGSIMAMVTLLAALGITRAMRPVRKLTEASERVAKRDLDVHIDVRTGDELEVLATAFNEMVDQLNASMKRIRWLAFMDDLTKLPNKTAFHEHLRRAANNQGASGAVLLVDLDRFKRLNDTLGQAEGDRILAIAADRLRAVAKTLRARYRHPDAKPPVLARLSGDEFALLIVGPAPTGAAKQTATDIVAALRQPFEISGQEIALTTSVGIARFPLDAAEPDHLLRHASLALDAVKAAGGGGYRFFEPEMTRRAIERVTLENELRQAVEREEFELHYQPKVDARSGEIKGAEALVRWRREGRLISPAVFIGAAEECGLVAQIGRFVLNEACRAAARWRAAGLRCSVAINVSALQFAADDFARTVLHALKEAELPADLLELELTESIAMSDPERVITQIEPLRAKGVRFAIDDFGTGHSSLGSLTRLPFDVFKIDQSFVRRMEDDSNDRVVIETILAMARALGYETVAEGVETASQFAFLRLNGCTYAQGYFFGKPAPEAEFVERLRQDSRPIASTPDIAHLGLRRDAG